MALRVGLRPQKIKAKKRKWLSVVLVVFLAGAAFWYFNLKTESTSAEIPNPIETIKEVIVEKPKPMDTTEIQNVINNYPNIEISVAIKDLENDFTYNLGKQSPFIAASTTKMITATSYLHQVELGSRTLTKQLGSYPASWHLKQLIQQSNNNSWEILNRDMGYKNVSAYAKEIGITTFDITNNKISASDELLLLTKLYRGELLNKGNSDLLYSYMTGTNFEKLIPAALPDYTVYHKYGQLNDTLHDAAIVKSENPFAIVIYTHTAVPTNQQAQTAVIHEIAKASARILNP